jgi:glycosyltransferase involved in cell wall biosynthesis
MSLEVEESLRILLTSHGYPPTISGVTLVVQRIGRAMVERGHDVTVITASERFDPYETEDAGVRVIRVASRKNPYWPANPVPTIALDELEHLIEQVRPDVIHAHDALPLCLRVMRLRSRHDTPLVATCHYYPSFVSAYVALGPQTHALVEGLAWAYSIALYNRMDRVVFPTYTHRDRFVAHGLTAPAEVISNGVDVLRYSPEVAPLDVTERYGVPDGAPRVLAVGRLAKDKNLEELIRAVARLRTPAPAHLLLAGVGPHEDALRACALSTGVAERVHFLGFVPEEDLPHLYRACHVFAITSNHEVQSIPALQAAATGLPIVAVNEGSLPEICRDGENGVLVRGDTPEEVAAALATALDPSNAERMGRASLRISRLHDERRTFERYEAVYAAVQRGARSGYVVA